jgi:hypothetical protein
MAYDAAEMKVYRIQTGRTANLSIPVSVLATLLAHTDARSVLHHHFGRDVCYAIEKSPKARSAATP